MSDSTAPAWATALLEAVNALRTEMRGRFDHIDQRVDTLENRIAAAEATRSEDNLARTQIRGWRQETGHE